MLMNKHTETHEENVEAFLVYIQHKSKDLEQTNVFIWILAGQVQWVTLNTTNISSKVVSVTKNWKLCTFQ